MVCGNAALSVGRAARDQHTAVRLFGARISYIGHSNAPGTVVALLVALICAAAVLWLLRREKPDPPSLDDSTAWRWVSSAPGINVYVHASSRKSVVNHAAAWIGRVLTYACTALQ